MTDNPSSAAQVMTTSLAWHPIEPLSPQDIQTDFSEVDALKAAWTGLRSELDATSPGELMRFNERLLRSWSIETGVIERIYDVDEGTTLTLIERGFNSELVDKSSSNMDPTELVAILRDHNEAAQLILEWAHDEKPFSRALLLQLHALLTRHQFTVEAQDSQGNLTTVKLIKGDFKKLPNNPRRPDGIIHEYCPPVHIASEIDTLIELLNEYSDQHPLLQAAWLHHRFTQIHPFQDGNGRVARCLVTLVLVRAGFLPIVVDRKARERYLVALEKADYRDLSGLVLFFTNLEQDVLLKALSIAKEAPFPGTTIVAQVTQNIAEKLKNRREKERADFLSVNGLAESLLKRTGETLDHLLQDTVKLLNDSDNLHLQFVPVKAFDEGGPHVGAREHYYRKQIVESAKEAGHWANFGESHYWIKRSFSHGPSRFIFFISFHHVGHELTGVMAATAFAEISFDSDETGPERKFLNGMLRHFTFTWKDELARIEYAYNDWLEECYALALQEWGDSL